MGSFSIHLLPNHPEGFSLSGDWCVWVHAACSAAFCDPIDCSPPGYIVYGIPQARTLDWIALPPPEDLPYPGIKLQSPVALALAGGFLTTEPPGKPLQRLGDMGITTGLPSPWNSCSARQSCCLEDECSSWSQCQGLSEFLLKFCRFC